MKKQTLTSLIIVSLFIITFAFIVSSAFAEQALPHQKWWNRPEVVKELNLSETQQKTIDSLFNEKKEGFKNLIQETRKIETDLKSSMGKEFDQTKALSLIDKLAENRSRMMKERLSMEVKIMSVLNPEQREKVAKKRQEMMNKRKGMLKDRFKGNKGWEEKGKGL